MKRPLISWLVWLALLAHMLAACGQASPPTQPTPAGDFGPQFVYLTREGYPGGTVWRLVTQTATSVTVKNMANGRQESLTPGDLLDKKYVYGLANLELTPVTAYTQPRPDSPPAGNFGQTDSFVIVNPFMCFPDASHPEYKPINWCYVLVKDKFEGWVQYGKFQPVLQPIEVQPK